MQKTILNQAHIVNTEQQIMNNITADRFEMTLTDMNEAIEEDMNWAQWASVDDSAADTDVSYQKDNLMRIELSEYLDDEEEHLMGELSPVNVWHEAEDKKSQAASVSSKSLLDMLKAFFQAIIHAISQFFAAIATTGLGFFKPSAGYQAIDETAVTQLEMSCV